MLSARGANEHNTNHCSRCRSDQIQRLIFLQRTSLLDLQLLNVVVVAIKVAS